jgi:hypothetical protein
MATSLPLSNEVVNQEFLKAKPFKDMELLSDIFPHPREPAMRTLHIVIQARPIGECSLSMTSLLALTLLHPLQRITR